MSYLLFWISFLLLFYIYFGYGIIVEVWSKIKIRKMKKEEIYPKVSIVIALFNEEKTVSSRLENIRALNYPQELIEIVAVSDGSTDRTVEIIRSFSGHNVLLLDQKEHKGKAFCLNEAVKRSSGEIIIFTDARQKFDQQCVEKLVQNFGDKNIGAVSGELLFYNEQKTLIGEGLDFYWGYEKFFRRRESKIDSTVGATGAIYAIRKDLYTDIPVGTILDDVLIPMQIVMQGYRCIFELEAKAYDVVSDTPAKESRRKIRTIAGNFQLFFETKGLLNPFKNRIWFQTISHKFLRVIAPLFIVLLFISNMFLMGIFVYRLIFFLQLSFYSLGIVGCLLSKRERVKFKLFSVASTFVMLTAFTVVALYRYLFCDTQVLWGQKSVDIRGKGVLQISKLYYPWIGGIEKSVQSMAEGIREKFDVEVLVCHDRKKSKIEEVNGINITKTGSLGIFFSMPTSFSFHRKLKEKSKKVKLLHFHTPFPLGELACLFSCENDKKVVVTYHSDVLRQKILLRMYKPFLNRFLDRADKIIVTSKNLLDNSSVLKHFRNKCKVIPLFIDIDEFSNRKSEEVRIDNPLNKKIILFVGRLTYYKGLEYLIDAMKEVDALSVIVGEGPLRNKLTQKISKLKLDKKVLFLGKLTDEQVKYCYQKSDIFVLPSIEKTEAFGLVQLEAMLSGKPVINTDLPTGVPFVSKNGETGITVPPKDPRALAIAINKLLCDKELSDNFGNKGIKRVNDMFSKDIVLPEIISLYNSLLEQQRSLPLGEK